MLDPDGNVFVGALAPYALQMTVTTDDVAFDLSTATVGRFEVRRQDGKEITWTAVLGTLTATTAALSHTFVADDLPKVETLRVYAVITLPSGDVVSEARVVQVVDPFAIGEN